MGSCTYYVITNRGRGLSKWLQYYIGGGLAKWLQYYIGVGQQMVTVLHRGVLANDSSIPWILGYYIRNIISIDLTKKSFFSFGMSHYLRGGNVNIIISLHSGGAAKWLQYYIGRGMPKWLQYYIGREGSLGTPKSDYVICARPLWQIFKCSFSAIFLIGLIFTLFPAVLGTKRLSSHYFTTFAA